MTDDLHDCCLGSVRVYHRRRLNQSLLLQTQGFCPISLFTDFKWHISKNHTGRSLAFIILTVWKREESEIWQQPGWVERDKMWSDFFWHLTLCLVRWLIALNLGWSLFFQPSAWILKVLLFVRPSTWPVTKHWNFEMCDPLLNNLQVIIRKYLVFSKTYIFFN